MTVHYDVAGGVATVRIDRPEVFNALNRETLIALRESFVKASADHGVGVVVLTGTGERAFSTGADLDEQQQFLDRPNEYWDWMSRFIEAIESIKDCAKPVVARLNGMVVGGGNEVKIAADRRAAERHGRGRRERAQHRMRPRARRGRRDVQARRAVTWIAAFRRGNAMDV